MTAEAYSNNNMLVLQYQQGSDEAFSELYQNNEGLIRNLINKYKHIQIIDQEVFFSACQLGFMKAAQSFQEDRETKFASYCTKIMEREILKEINFMKQKGRDTMIKTSDSMNRMINGKEDSTEMIWMLDVKEEDKYFNGHICTVTDAINYALNKSKSIYKNYFTLILNDDMTQQEVADIFKCSKQKLQYHFKNFKEDVKKYLQTNHINSSDDAVF